MRDLSEPGAARARRRATGLLVLAALAGAAVWAVRDVPTALGGRPGGADAELVRASPHFRDGVFHNPPTTRTTPAAPGRTAMREMLLGARHRRPSLPIPLVDPTTGTGGDADLAVTWYGHASALIEMDGRRVLVDPIWSDRCSPSRLVGPHRLHPVPVRLESLPAVDAVLISHDHYDHLDLATVRALRDTGTAPFLVPLAVGAHLRRWGVPEERIVELDWGQRAAVAGLTFTATPARHFSGRGLVRDRTLWSSWVVTGRDRRVFYTGDSGYFDGYARIGREHGPFDLTLIQIGAYDPAWPNIHMFPEEAVSAHLDLRGGLLVPVHWATFNLAPHSWADPVDRLWRQARERDVRLAVPRPGERIVVDDPPPVDSWWCAVR